MTGRDDRLWAMLAAIFWLLPGSPVNAQDDESVEPLVVERLLEAGGLQNFDDRNLLAVRSTIAPAESGSLHTHPGPEVLYVLQGRGQISLDEQITPLTAGDIILVPQNTRKQVKNLSATEELQYLAVLFVEKDKPVSTVLDAEPESDTVAGHSDFSW